MYHFDSRVRYSETDEQGQLSLTGILNYFQDCSTFQSEDLGMGVGYLKEHGRAWWLTSWQIVIDRYPSLGEEITVSTWPYDFKGLYGYRNFAITGSDGRYAARANMILRIRNRPGYRSRISADTGSGNPGWPWTMLRERSNFPDNMTRRNRFRWPGITWIPTIM